MNRKVLLSTLTLIFLSFLAPSGFAQNWVNVAGGTSADMVASLTSDDAGNVYTTGNFEGTANFSVNDSLISMGETDAFIAKYSESGLLSWLYQMSSDSAVMMSGITTDADGNMIVSGTFSGDLLVDNTTTLTSMGMEDMFVASFGSSGELNWAMNGGGSMDDRSLGLTSDLSGNILVSGSFEDEAIFGSDTLNSEGMKDMFALMLDAQGNVTWSFSAGGASDDFANNIAADAFGNIYLKGSFDGTIDFAGTTMNSLFGEQLLAKFDGNSGSLNFVQEINSTYSFDRNGMTADNDGNLYVTGNFQGTGTFGTTTLISAGSDDMLLIKYDSTGSVLWAEGFGGAGFDAGRDISIAQDGSVFLTGTFENNLTAGAESLESAGGSDVAIIEMDANGSVMAAYSAGGTSDETVSAISGSNSGEFTLSGSFMGSADFGSESAESSGERDGYTWNRTSAVFVDAEIATENRVVLYPNPVSGNQLFVELNTTFNTPINAEIYHFSGQKVMARELSQANAALDLTGLEDGIYFVKLHNESADWSVTRKVIIR